MVLRKRFQDYAAAHGAGLGGVPPPEPLPLMTLNPPPQPTFTLQPPPPPQEFASSPLRLQRLLGGVSTTMPVLPASPNAPATIAPGANPIERTGNEFAAMVAGTHDPSVSAPGQAVRAAATGAQGILMGADLPRQMVVTADADAFMDDLTKEDRWSVIMQVMSNLGGLNAPPGILTQRGEAE